MIYMKYLVIVTDMMRLDLFLNVVLKVVLLYLPVSSWLCLILDLRNY